MQIDKLCKQCGVTKPAEAFSVIKRPYKGVDHTYLQSYCKPCVVERSKLHVQSGYVRPAKKVLNDIKEMRMMKSPISWHMHKHGEVASTVKVYPVCRNGHRYVGPTCLPCKYGVFAKTVV